MSSDVAVIITPQIAAALAAMLLHHADDMPHLIQALVVCNLPDTLPASKM